MDSTHWLRATGSGVALLAIAVSVDLTRGAGLDLDHLEPFFCPSPEMAG